MSTQTESKESTGLLNIDPVALRGAFSAVMAIAAVSVVGLLWEGNQDLNRVRDYVERAEQKDLISRVDGAEGSIEQLRRADQKLDEHIASILEVLKAYPNRAETQATQQSFDKGITTLKDRFDRFEGRIEKRFDDLESRINEVGTGQ